MKKINLLIIIISINLLSGFAQQSTINFENGILLYEFFVKEHERGTIQYYSDGDTIIEGEKFYRWNEYRQSFPGMSSTYNIISHDFVGYIRDDSITKKVYYTYDSNNIEVLFDYGLSIGELWWDIELRAIDSISICNQKRRRLRFDTYGPYDFIEGIGPDGGFFDFEPNEGEAFVKLYCYYERNNPDCDSCNLLYNHLTKSMMQPEEVIVYPTPSSGEIFIESFDFIPEQVIDIFGKNLYFENNPILPSSYKITIREKGVFILKLRDKSGNMLFRKIIIQ